MHICHPGPQVEAVTSSPSSLPPLQSCPVFLKSSCPSPDFLSHQESCDSLSDALLVSYLPCSCHISTLQLEGSLGSYFLLRLGNGFPILTSCLRISGLFFLVDHRGEAAGRLRAPGLQGEKSKLGILKSLPVRPQPTCSAVFLFSSIHALCASAFL